MALRAAHRLVRAALLLLLGASATLGATAAAEAHAALLASAPPAGAVLTVPPLEAELRFGEPVQPLLLQLVLPDGSIVPLTEQRADGPVLTVPLPRLGSGTHALSWRVASADGHPIGGTLLFSIGAPSSASPPGEAGLPARTVLAAIWFSRLLTFLALTVGVGGSFWIVCCVPASLRLARQGAHAVLAVGAAALALSVGLQGLDALALPWASLLAAEPWRAGAATTYARTALLGLCSLAAAAVALRLPPLPAKLFAAAGLLGAGVALAASGHAGTAEPTAIARVLVLVHVATIAMWIGALLPLALLIHLDRAAGKQALAAFTRAIPLPLALVLASGAGLALVQLTAVSDLWSTDYGRVLAAKLAAVAALLVLALLNRRLLAPAFRAGDERGRRWLIASIAAEIVLATMILSAASLWRFTPPPRVLAQAASAAAEAHLETGHVLADLTLRRGSGGAWTLQLELQSVGLEPLEAKEVTVLFSSRAGGIEPIRLAAERIGPGRWRVDNLRLPDAAGWQVEAEVLLDDFERVTLEGFLPLGVDRTR